MDVAVRSSSVLMESASHEPLSVTMMMTVGIGVMKTLAVWYFFFSHFLQLFYWDLVQADSRKQSAWLYSHQKQITVLQVLFCIER